MLFPQPENPQQSFEAVKLGLNFMFDPKPRPKFWVGLGLSAT